MKERDYNKIDSLIQKFLLIEVEEKSELNTFDFYITIAQNLNLQQKELWNPTEWLSKMGFKKKYYDDTHLYK